jgi:hypothetical protein
MAARTRYPNTFTTPTVDAGEIPLTPTDALTKSA